MSGRLHDEEPDTGISVVLSLLRSQVPRLAALPLGRLSSTGTDNAMYRLGSFFVVRLPRIMGAARGLTAEIDWLPRLRGRLSVTVPELVHAGEPTDAYPYPWAVLGWLDGTDAWAARHQEAWFGAGLGHDLANTVLELRATPIDNAPIRQPGTRGGPLSALDDRVRWWLDQAHGLIDVPAVTRIWDQCLESADYAAEPTLMHGDLIPGNLLIDRGRLAGVIDWGGIGAGDPAQDLSPAWSVLDSDGAAAFRKLLEVDSQTWMRARGFVLEQSIGGVIYYTPRQHPLADVMRRSLSRLLTGL
jgi:aminoglycoside phosphotransferase (APT) family kinase protein